MPLVLAAAAFFDLPLGAAALGFSALEAAGEVEEAAAGLAAGEEAAVTGAVEPSARPGPDVAANSVPMASTYTTCTAFMCVSALVGNKSTRVRKSKNCLHVYYSGAY